MSKKLSSKNCEIKFEILSHFEFSSGEKSKIFPGVKQSAGIPRSIIPIQMVHYHLPRFLRGVSYEADTGQLN